jgi:hypothetical protein
VIIGVLYARDHGTGPGTVGAGKAVADVHPVGSTGMRIGGSDVRVGGRLPGSAFRAPFDMRDSG